MTSTRSAQKFSTHLLPRKPAWAKRPNEAAEKPLQASWQAVRTPAALQKPLGQQTQVVAVLEALPSPCRLISYCISVTDRRNGATVSDVVALYGISHLDPVYTDVNNGTEIFVR